MNDLEVRKMIVEAESKGEKISEFILPKGSSIKRSYGIPVKHRRIAKLLKKQYVK